MSSLLAQSCGRKTGAAKRSPAHHRNCCRHQLLLQISAREGEGWAPELGEEAAETNLAQSAAIDISA